MEQAGQTALFGLTLWLKCALAGVGIGAAVAAAQIFPGRWHPAWAHNLFYWFSCPLFAGLAAGVLMALKVIPAVAEGRSLWLLLCLLIGGFTAILAAGALAYLTRNHDPGATSKSKRATRRHTGRRPLHTPVWEDRLRSVFRPTRKIDSTENTIESNITTSTHGSIAGQKAKLPPERYPLSEVSVRVPRYAGKPLRTPSPEKSQGKLEKPIK